MPTKTHIQDRRTFLKTSGAAIASACVLPFASCAKKNDEIPNIVLVVADDLGYGDLSCYGQTRFTTPNIDCVTQEGVRFTQFYAGSTVCAPSRSVLLTGLHTGHTPIRGNKSVEPEGQVPLPQSSATVSDVLRKSGYATGAFGKWGLGFMTNEGDPAKHGFDKFFGYYSQSLAHRYYPEYIWDDRQKITLQNNGMKTIDYAPDIIHSQALQFIEQNREHTFFLFLPYTLPHAELIVPEDELLQQYRNKFLPEKEYVGDDYGENYNDKGYCSQKECHAVFAAMIARLDRYVGELLAKLQEVGIDRNTLLLFTSDNGPHQEGGADPDYFDSNGPLKGYKRDLYEGGILVPLVARWPGKIRPGSISDHVSAFWDIMPTFADIAHIDAPVNIDGISFLPELTGEGRQKEHDYLYWEFHEQGGKQAVRWNNWKGIRFNVHTDPHSPIQLFDLVKDISEDHDVAAEHPDVVKRINEIMNKEHTHSPLFPYQYEERE
jgi:arylsulfatase A